MKILIPGLVAAVVFLTAKPARAVGGGRAERQGRPDHRDHPLAALLLVSTVHKFPTGEIMVTMRMSPDECNPEGDFSAVAFSKDGGLTWSQRFTMGAGANVDGAYSASSPPQDGTILEPATAGSGCRTPAHRAPNIRPR